jgi:transposase-like protein
VVARTLEDLVREGARRMRADALEEEVTAFLGRAKGARGGPFRGYRNGYQAPREVTIGALAVPVQVPRVAEVPPEVAPEGFSSRLVPKYQRTRAATQQLFARLYLEGLATGDFEPVFRALVGETTALSPAALVRLKAAWAEEYAAWRRRRRDGHRYAYLWADGVYLGVGDEPERTAVLVVLGARADGAKELLSLAVGYRESAESWAEVLRDLRERGLAPPLLAIGDGALGLWAALRAVFPATRHQRCWNHRVLNVQDQLPKRLQADARRQLRAIAEAPTRADAERQRDAYVAALRAAGQGAAADTVARDWEDFVTLSDFPAEHRVHLRTSNPLESVFAGVRLRTDAAKRMRTRETALYLIWKLVARLGERWRLLNGGATLMPLVLDGDRFVDGIRQPPAAVSAA